MLFSNSVKMTVNYFRVCKPISRLLNWYETYFRRNSSICTHYSVHLQYSTNRSLSHISSMIRPLTFNLQWKLVMSTWYDDNCCDVHDCHNQPKMLQHQPQLSQKNTIVATQITIVTILIKYNCRNTNQMSQLFCKNNVASLTSILHKIMTFDPNFNIPCFTSHN